MRSVDGDFRFELCSQELVLLPEKALFWVESRFLIVADLHLGKAGHFRKAGIPVSSRVHEAEWAGLAELVAFWQPERLLILGDLFHSSLNREWGILREWQEAHPNLAIDLVVGNHDLHGLEHAKGMITTQAKEVEHGPFLFTHEPSVEQPIPEGRYNLSGHWHPGVVLTGIGRQHLRLPCFYFADRYGVLPAYGKFTGTHSIRPKPTDQVFACLPNKIMPVGQH